MDTDRYRIEKDLLGELPVPVDAYWGIHTQRALKNFPLSKRRVPLRLIRALAQVKKAASLANAELGYLERGKAGAIASACDEVVAGRRDEQFLLDALQGGAGTSTNMNVNEVIANRALELLGFAKGAYEQCHPLDDVNLHQSTNDVYPTALKVAFMAALQEGSEAIARLQGVFQKKEKEFAGIVKIGRTEMQEAVPMTLGVEFSAFAEAIARDRWRVAKCLERLRLVNLGGTAVGTGLGAAQKYIFLVIEKLREVTQLNLARGENVVDQTANTDCFIETSGILKAHAADLVKICNDLRWLGSLGEIRLPAVQAGSSIMPGKVNPVILESVIQAALCAMADEALVAEAVTRGTLQINEFMPLLSFALLDMAELLMAADRMLADYLEGVTADQDACQQRLDQSLMLITAFVPYLGYEKTQAILQEFRFSDRKDFRVFLAEKIGREAVDQILSPENLNRLGYRDDTKNA